MRILASALLLGVSSLLAACMPMGSQGGPGGGGPGGGCSSDQDCPGGTQCSRFGTCESGLVAITATWTVNGQPASTMACSGIDHLEVDYMASGQAIGGFEPVPCASGLLHFDRLPPEIDTVRVTELSGQTIDLGIATAPVKGPASDERAALNLPLPSP